MTISFVFFLAPVIIHAENLYNTLERIEQMTSVESLLPFLKDKDQRICAAAASALGKLGDRQAVNPLLELLEKEPFDINNDCKSNAVVALGRLKDPRAFDPLLVKLSAGQCRTCANALIEIIPVATEARLILPAIKADDKTVRLATAQALEQLGWQPATTNEEIDFLIAKQDWDGAASKGAEAMAPLESLLRSFFWMQEHDYIVLALGKISDPRVIVILNYYINNGANPKGRKLAVEIMGGIEGNRATETLMYLMQAYDFDIRILAMQMLTQRKATQAVPLIVSALTGDQNSSVREAAASSLDGLGWKPVNATEKAAYYIAKKDVDKCAALGAEAVEPILSLAFNMNFVRDTLVKIGTPAVEPLIAVLEKKRNAFRNFSYISQEGLEYAVVEILSEINDPRAIEALNRAVQGPDTELSRSAAKVLGKIKSPHTITALTSLLKDDIPHNREKAAEALRDMGWSPSTDEEKLYYYAAIFDMAECVKIGLPAMNLLVESIGNHELHMFFPLIDQMESARAIELLKRFLNFSIAMKFGREDAFQIRQKAAEALARIGWTPSTNEEKAAYYIARQNWDECEKMGAKAVPSLSALLDANNDTDILYSVIEILGKIKDPRSIKPLIYVLSVPEFSSFWEFDARNPKTSLLEFGATAVEPLIDAFKNPLITIDPANLFRLKTDRKKFQTGASPFKLSRSEREEIQMDCDNFIKKLIANNWAIPINTREVLLIGNWREEKDKISKELGDEYRDFVDMVENERYRERPLMADLEKLAPIIAEIGDKRAIPALVENLQDLEAYDEIASALQMLGWQPQTPREQVYYMINTNDRRCLSEKWETVKKVLLEDVRSGETRAVYYALNALVAMGKDEVIPELVEILNTKNSAMIAEAYCRRGFAKLYKEGNKWLEDHGYRWVTLVGGGDDSPAAWEPW